LFKYSKKNVKKNIKNSPTTEDKPTLRFILLVLGSSEVTGGWWFSSQDLGDVDAERA
jgi:hypothetical protein